MTVVQVVSVLLEMLLELISGYVYVIRNTDMVHDGTAVLVHDVGWVVGGVVVSGEDGYVGSPLNPIVDCGNAVGNPAGGRSQSTS